jgi:hypothetical protein
MKKSSLFPLFIMFMVSNVSCSEENDPDPLPTLVKQWDIILSTAHENPKPSGRTETGTAVLQLMSDNSLTYTLTVSSVLSGDALTVSHLHVGNAITNGPVVLDLNPSFAAGSASGKLTNLRSSLIDSLKNDDNEIYLNVHSTQVPSGLVRGQLNRRIELAADVVMTSANEVPAGTSLATGLGLLRLTSDKQLYTRINISNLESSDAMTVAHIHKGAAGANGSVLIDIYSAGSQFGTVKTTTVDDATITILKNDPLYFNAHSTSKPAGLVRGQIR